jgi:uncharacterized membrane protein (DUF441 family)
MGTYENMDKVKFSPSIANKDIIIGIIIITTIMVMTSSIPIITIDVENYNLANPLRSPVHIQPE